MANRFAVPVTQLVNDDATNIGCQAESSGCA